MKQCKSVYFFVMRVIQKVMDVGIDAIEFSIDYEKHRYMGSFYHCVKKRKSPNVFFFKCEMNRQVKR